MDGCHREALRPLKSHKKLLNLKRNLKFESKVLEDHSYKTELNKLVILNTNMV